MNRPWTPQEPSLGSRTLRWTHALLVASLITTSCRPQSTTGSDAPPPLPSVEIRPSSRRADQLRARLASCARISRGLFKPDQGPSIPATIPICALGDVAIYWRADMDIDCDGRESAACNKRTDPWFQAETTATTRTGSPLQADLTPYVVIPKPSPRFDYREHGLTLGAVVMVVYHDKIEFGVFADTGPADIIGEASYAMAKRLGIDPDPKTGGAEDEVLYVAFRGDDAVPKDLEDHEEATRIGLARLAAAFPGL